MKLIAIVLLFIQCMLVGFFAWLIKTDAGLFALNVGIICWTFATAFISLATVIKND